MAQEQQTQDMNVNSVFGLTAEQTWLLYCCQYTIIFQQYYAENNAEKKERKKLWMEKWVKATNDILINEFRCNNGLTIAKNTLSKRCQEIQQSTPSTAWKYLILLESVVFRPYFALGGEKEDAKLVKRLTVNKDQHGKTLEDIAELLGIDKSYIGKFSKGHKDALKRLGGDRVWKIIAVSVSSAILLVLAVLTFQPEIIAILAPILAPGLHGAAATAAVLAALGGGSIAAGGFGMAGGVAVLVGGGALIGGGAGSSVSMILFKESSAFTLSQAAKMEVVLKEIVLGIQNDVKMFQAILLKQQEQIARMRAELINMKNDNEKNKKDIKNMKESIEILEKLCKIQ